MKQTGIVQKCLANQQAEVLIHRVSACSHDCHHCAGCGAINQTIRVVAINSLEAKAGQTVEIESSTKTVLIVSLLAYLLPFLCLFICYFCVPSQWKWHSWLSFLGFLLGWLPVILYEKKKKKNGISFTIVRIIPDDLVAYD